MRLYSLLLTSLAVAVVHADSCKVFPRIDASPTAGQRLILMRQNAPEPTIYPLAPAIKDGQNIQSKALIGAPATPNKLAPLYVFHPDASLLHANGANSGTRDDAGPLGYNSKVTSSAEGVNIILWGSDGGMTCGYANTSTGGNPVLGLVALDPHTYQILATWYPPDNETLNLSYMELIKETNDIVVATLEGHIYVVHRDSCKGHPYFTLERRISLAGTLKPGEELLNALQDAAGNIWYTSGSVPLGGQQPQASLTYGYITPGGKIISRHVATEAVANGIAVSGENMYMLTSPTNVSSDQSVGYMYSLTTGKNNGIKVNWRTSYTAQPATKPGEQPLGAGSTPALATDKYVAITDRASPQVNLIVYHQEAQGSGKDQFVCKIPLFEPGKSDNDNAILAHFDGETNGFIVQNDYNIPAIYAPKPGQTVHPNGKWNDMSKMPGGMMRIDVDDCGKCSVRWYKKSIAIKSVSMLSTEVGLIYTWTQDKELAAKGEYIWYTEAVEWDTGKTAYKRRMGTGGVFNDNYLGGVVGPTGTFYQTTFGGIVGLTDEGHAPGYGYGHPHGY